MIKKDQMPARFRDLIDEEIAVYRAGASIQERSSIPDTTEVPSRLTSEGKAHWLRVPGVICVFADMRNSTGLTKNKQDRVSARVYQLFIETAVRLFHAAESAYIDVQGDGAFALFDSDEPHRALAAAVNFKTFVKSEFIPRIVADLNVDVGCHLGMDTTPVLVRKLGLQPRAGRTDRQNEVWAGRAINVAAKLGAAAGDDELLVSERMFKLFTHPKSLRSCGCPGGFEMDLWNEHQFHDPALDFTTRYSLRNVWCEKHGADFCDELIKTDV